VGRAHADAARDPSPARLQRAVGAGILGLIPLEAGLLAGTGSVVPAAGVATLWPLARRASRKRAVT
jgi:4-hydroxybenzoate polyprenyltransferase